MCSYFVALLLCLVPLSGNIFVTVSFYGAMGTLDLSGGLESYCLLPFQGPSSPSRVSAHFILVWGSRVRDLYFVHPLASSVSFSSFIFLV